MKIFCHHIYEYKKGLRNLVLHTLPIDSIDLAKEKLIMNKIPYIIRIVNSKKINVFFGAKECVDVVSSFGDKPLNKFTDEEDFILGIMLGYSRIEQCKRYIKRKSVNTLLASDSSFNNNSDDADKYPVLCTN